MHQHLKTTLPLAIGTDTVDCDDEMPFESQMFSLLCLCNRFPHFSDLIIPGQIRRTTELSCLFLEHSFTDLCFD